MDCTLRDLERLEEQIFSYNPSLKATVSKQHVSNCLRNQLIESKAVVRIQRMDSECESLMISLKQRLMLLQDILKPKDKDVQKELKEENEVIKLNLSSDSSDDETLMGFVTKQMDTESQKVQMSKKSNLKAIAMQHTDTSEPLDSDLPLALRKKRREKNLSCKSFSSSASTSHSKNSRSKKLHNKEEHTVTTSGVTFHSEEMLVEQEQVDTTPTLHIKIPSLHRGNVHYIILDSMNFARKVFDYRANEVKQQKSSITHSTKISKSRKKQVKSISSNVIEQLTQQEQESELSQLIEDVMAEACNDETLQATSALENINNNLIDNYDPNANDNLITYSQSSQELSLSQNSNAIIDTVCSTSSSSNLQKKPRKNSKRTNDQLQHQPNNEPPKKRGRKTKKKSYSDNQQLQTQPPTKSNLAKYVEFFANDCELLPGSTTPAASSTRSQPLVSSTTHNFEVIDQLPQQQHHEQQTYPQQPITYYIDGDWANGGLCHLVATNGMSVDARQINQDDMNAPFQDFVNYIDNSSDSGNNVIARVLENNNSLPISIPLPIANLGHQNKSHQQAPRQIQQSLQNSLLPVINIQIPNLPKNIISPTAPPPPAHTHKDILDLSIKSKFCADIVSSEVLNLNQISNNNLETSCLTEDDDCLPLDLSTKGSNAREKQAEAHSVTIDKQDEDFIRRLIEQSDYEYTREQLKKGGETTALAYDNDNNNKSFKAALDMPLLDFDATNLSQLVENTSTASKKLQDNLTDSNYVSMTAMNSSMENNLHLSDQSTSEIFNKLLDICPDNQFLDNISNEFISNDDLNESVFDHCRVENSTMCEIENSTNPKHQPNAFPQNICDTTSHYNQDRENNTSTDEALSSTSTSLAVQIDSSNKTATDLNISMSSNMSINFKLSSNDKEIDLKDAETAKMYQISDDPQQNAAVDEQKVTKISNIKTSLKNNTNVKEISDESSANFGNNLHKDQNAATDAQFICLKINENINDKCSSSPTTNLKKCEHVVTNKQKIDAAITNTIEKEVNDKCLAYAENKNANNKDIVSLESKQQKVEAKDDKCFANSQNNKGQENIIEIENAKTFKSVENNKAVNVKCLSNNILPKSNLKENVLFSVAKITLTEDDNMFNTDSDTASGKSFDAGEMKPIEKNTQKEDLTFNSVNITEYKSDTKNKAFKDCQDSVDTIHREPKKCSENVIMSVNDNEHSNESVSILNEINNYCTDVIHLSVSCESNSEETSTDSGDDEMNHLTIETHKRDTESKAKAHANYFSKEPKYTENGNENSNASASIPNETKNTESCCDEVINLSVSFKNNQSVREDLNIYNNNKLNEDSINSTKNVESTTVESQKNDKNLTLLELESKLEGSLDFDEDFDDALSLATSCFDSPNDDRFEDSFVFDVDTTTATSTHPPPALESEHNVNANSTPNKDLKHFKIPKLNTSAGTSSKIAEKEPDIKTLDKPNTSSKITEKEADVQKLDSNGKATNPIPTLRPLLKNFEKITRTVKNDFVVHTKENSAEVILLAAHLNDEIQATEHIISEVFGITCLPYLVDNCFAITHCQSSHQLNDADTVYEHLNTLDRITMNLTYQVLYNHAKLFKKYFKVFCIYYVTKNDRIKLLNMVNDCERYPEYAEFIIVIYESLIKCGLSRVNACRLILQRIRELTTASTIVEALVDIIMKSDWTMFTDFIEKYTQEMYKFNFRIFTLEQMVPEVLNSKGPHLKQVFGKCVQTLHCDDTGLLQNSPGLIQCVALLTTST